MKSKLFILPQHLEWANKLKSEFDVVVIQADGEYTKALRILDVTGLPVALLNSKTIKDNYITKVKEHEIQRKE